MPRPGEIDDTYVLKLASIGLSLLEPFHGAKAHHKLQCKTCAHIWNATPISKLQSHKKYGGNGCPICTANKKAIKLKDIRSVAIQAIESKGFTILSEYDGQQTTTQKIEVRNIFCGHEFWSAPGNLLHNEVQCPTCNTERKKANFQKWGKERQSVYLITASEWQKYKSSVYSITRQSYQQHKAYINPLRLPTGRAGTTGAYHLDHIVSVRYCYEHSIPAEVCGHPQNLQMLPWEINLSHKDKLKDCVPPIFHRYIPASYIERDFTSTLQNELQSDGVAPEGLMDPHHITFWIDSANTAIIFRPIQSSLEQVSQNRRACVELLATAKAYQINCIIVYEDEWFNNRRLVLSKIRHIAKVSSAPSVHARQCNIRPIHIPSEKSRFLTRNHIQGNDKAQIALGAYYEDNLIAIMTFAKPRVALGAVAEEGIWELSRFATDVEYRIPGIASRLLTYFTKHHQWTQIYSYADRRWSEGNMYIQLGFNRTMINPPEYYYIRDGIRMHRWNYRKDVIKDILPNFDANLTEYQNMLNHGHDRVWGAGTIRFDMTKE